MTSVLLRDKLAICPAAVLGWFESLQGLSHYRAPQAGTLRGAFFIGVLVRFSGAPWGCRPDTGPSFLVDFAWAAIPPSSAFSVKCKKWRK